MERLLAKRTLGRAARLLARGEFTRSEYALVAIDLVARLGAEPPDREKGWYNATFALETGQALRLTPSIVDLNPSATHVTPVEYGPMGGAFSALSDSRAINLSHGVYDPRTDTFTGEYSWHWEPKNTAALKRARQRLHWWNRAGETLDAWRGEQARIFPNLHGDVWKVILAVVSFAVGFLLRGFLRPQGDPEPAARDLRSALASLSLPVRKHR
jgi:hypothetical protein